MRSLCIVHQVCVHETLLMSQVSTTSTESGTQSTTKSGRSIKPTEKVKAAIQRPIAKKKQVVMDGTDDKDDPTECGDTVAVGLPKKKSKKAVLWERI